MIPIETPRLVLRQFTYDDHDHLCRLLGDPQVMRFSRNGPLAPPQVAESLDRWLNDYSQKRYGIWAAILKADQRFVGLCGLNQQTVEGSDELEVAYRLRPEFWNRGFATEAAAAASAYAFSQLATPRLIAIIDPLNFASQRVAEKIGLRYEKDAVCWNLPLRIYANTSR